MKKPPMTRRQPFVDTDGSPLQNRETERDDWHQNFQGLWLLLFWMRDKKSFLSTVLFSMNAFSGGEFFDGGISLLPSLFTIYRHA